MPGCVILPMNTLLTLLCRTLKGKRDLYVSSLFCWSLLKEPLIVVCFVEHEVHKSMRELERR